MYVHACVRENGRASVLACVRACVRARCAGVLSVTFKLKQQSVLVTNMNHVGFVCAILYESHTT